MGGDVSSDEGITTLRAADQRAGLCRALDAVLEDLRDPDLITHRQIDLLRQHIYGLALGYRDKLGERRSEDLRQHLLRPRARSAKSS